MLNIIYFYYYYNRNFFPLLLFVIRINIDDYISYLGAANKRVLGDGSKLRKILFYLMF